VQQQAAITNRRACFHFGKFLPRDWNAAIFAGELDSHQIATR